MLALACLAVLSPERMTAAPPDGGLDASPSGGAALRLRRGDVDARALSKASSPHGRVGSGLFVVQFERAVLDAWRAAATADGLEVIAPIPDDGMLVRGHADAVARFVERPYVRGWMPYGPRERLDPALDAAVENGGTGDVPVAVQIVGDEAGEELARRLEREAATSAGPTSRVAGFVIVRGVWSSATLATLLGDASVVNVEAVGVARLCEERAGVVVAGLLDATGARPGGPGYVDWLAAKGFSGGTFDFGIDFTDTGLDRGVANDAGGHPDFRDASGSSRVAYAASYVANSSPADVTGHGTLNASIAAGYNVLAGAPYQDADGYRYGLGIAPFARIGSSKVFDDLTGEMRLTASFATIAARAHRSGMRMWSNSWGVPGNRYTLQSMEYDALVRDADPETPGNQELTTVVASGNTGSEGSVWSPGTAKNVITVGASENFRLAGAPDGCDVGDDAADDVRDVAPFSSRGPVNDGRIKPDIVAPGSHMQGSASRNSFFTATGLCVDRPAQRYYPPGQTLYAWASGTSQAAPVVSGAAALVRAYAVAHAWLPGNAAPSPAMIKALLLGAATPMTGANAGARTPDGGQGFGRVSLGPVFDDAARTFVDQSVRFTESDQVYETSGFVGDPSRPLRVALAWTDAPGLPSAAPWVNDLDLEVRIGDLVFVGNVLQNGLSEEGGDLGRDRRNTAEVVVVPAGTRGPFTVTVRAVSVAGDGVPGDADATDQDFALVVYNVEDGRWPYPMAPVVSSTEAKGKKPVRVTIAGEHLSGTTTAEINGIPVPAALVRYDEGTGRLLLEGKRKELAVVRGDNRLVLANGDLRSTEVVFRYRRR
jgi:hypothetical protein